MTEANTKKISLDKKLEKTIEYLAYGMILLFYTGKVFQVFVLLIDILFLILLVYKKDTVFIQKHKKILILFSILFLYLFVQSFWAEYILVALRNSVGMIRFVILIFALYYVFNSNKKIERMIYAVLIILTALLIDGIYQYVNGYDLFGYPVEEGAILRLTAWSDTPKLGESLGLLVGIVLSSFIILKQKTLSLSMLLALFFVMLISGNRGPIVYILGAIFIVVLFTRYRHYLIYLGITMVTLVVLTFSFNQNVFQQYKVYKNPFISANNSGRTTIYKSGIEMFKEHPLLGIGGKNFRHEFHKYYEKVYNPLEDTGFWDKYYVTETPFHVHSMFLSFLLNWGLIGSLLFVWIVFVLYKMYIVHNEAAIITSVSFVYTVFPLNFGKSIAQGQWQFYIFLTLAFAMVVGNYRKTFLRKSNELEEN